MTLLDELPAHAIVDAMPDAVLFIDGAGRIAWASLQAETLFGYRRDELIGESVERLVPDQHRHGHEQKRAAYQAAPRPRRMGTGLTLTARRKDGSELPVEISLAPLAHDGQSCTLAVVRDVSERRRMEQQLGQAQKLEAVGRLAGGVAHDFNNALAVILGTATLAAESLAPGDALRDDLADIIAAGEHAAAVTRQLLAFSRKQMISPQPTDLNAVVTEVARMLSHLLAADVELDLRLAGELGTVVVDPTQAEQVVLNLALNAKDAMPRGGRLTIETANVELDEAYAATHVEVQPGPHVLLAVSDTGAGMDQETLARIFEPFFTTKQGKGTGLGLASVHGVIKQSGGHIWVYSELGVGTTFKLYLPRVERAQARPVGRPSTQPPAGGEETILIVEDNDLVRNTAVAILRRKGYRILAAGDAAEALQACERHQGAIHLLLTDVVLPGMSGRDLAERLVPLRPSMRVLYMSGYTENTVVHYGVLDADIQFVGKPFTPELLARRVRELLDLPARDEG